MAKRKRPAFGRTTISLPSDLHRQMQKCDGVNWSAVAAAAFAAEVARHNCQKERPEMDDVIERLRASEREFASAMFEQGREAGEEWAKRSAEAVELRSLQRAWDSRDRSNSEPGNWLYWGDQNPPPSNQFWNIIEEVAQHADARDFWIAVTNEEESLADEIEFVHGFAAGALNVWSEVKDKI